MTCRANRRIVPPRVPIEHDEHGKPLDEETHNAMAAAVIAVSCTLMVLFVGLPLFVVWWLIGW
jgi:hypothetical protein